MLKNKAVYKMDLIIIKGAIFALFPQIYIINNTFYKSIS
jgi:hypothetical protein